MNLKEVPTVGDSLRDLQAGQAAGCAPHLVRTGKAGLLDATQMAQLLDQVPNTVVHADLAAFAAYLIQRQRAESGDSGESDSGYGEGR